MLPKPADASRFPQGGKAKMATTNASATVGVRDPEHTLVELGRCTLVAPGEEELWADAVDILREPLQVDYVAALRCSEDESGLDLVAGAGVDESLVGTHIVDVGTGTATDIALDSDEPLVFDDIDAEQNFLPSPIATHHHCKSGLAIAVRHNGTRWGVCEFLWNEPHMVGSELVEFAQLAIELLGEALERIERDRRQMSSLREAERENERFFLLVENATDMIGMSDLDGRVTYLNPAGCRMVGVEPGEAVGRPVEDFLTDAEAKRFCEAIVPQVNEHGSWDGHLDVCGFEPPVVHHTEATVLLLRDLHTDEPVGCATILRDISEQRHLEDQLRQSQKLEALGLLAGGVAHDFNNHLTVIKGYSEILLSGVDEQDARRPQLEKIHRVSEKAQLLADQLLTFSRRKARQPRVLDLNEALTSLIDMLRSLIGENITLNCVTSDAPNFIEIEPSDVEQVILNLAVNARDAIEGNGTITISTRRGRPEEIEELDGRDELGEDPVVLEVRDNGKGMPQEVLEHVFEPFFTTKDARKGTGLGLATVYRIVGDVGGDIAVVSKPGWGTCFKLFFPQAEAPPDQEKDVPYQQTALEGDEVVLVVEDDPDVLGFVTDVLQRYGYDTMTSADGQRAIELLDMYHDSIDAVICDVVLPGITTDELRSELIDRYPQVPFVMTSGYSDLQEKDIDGSFDDQPFVAKPLTARDLLGQLRSVLDSQAPE